MTDLFAKAEVASDVLLAMRQELLNAAFLCLLCVAFACSVVALLGDAWFVEVPIQLLVGQQRTNLTCICALLLSWQNLSVAS